MKKIILLLATSLITLASFAQIIPHGTPNYVGQSNPNTTTGFLGSVQAGYGFINAVYTDTTAANAVSQDIKSIPGFQIFTSSDNNFWIRSFQVNEWIKVTITGGGGSQDLWSTTHFGDSTNTALEIVNGAGGTILSSMRWVNDMGGGAGYLMAKRASDGDSILISSNDIKFYDFGGFYNQINNLTPTQNNTIYYPNKSGIWSVIEIDPDGTNRDVILDQHYLSAARRYNFPNTAGTFVLSVDGNTPDSLGNVVTAGGSQGLQDVIDTSPDLDKNNILDHNGFSWTHDNTDTFRIKSASGLWIWDNTLSNYGKITMDDNQASLTGQNQSSIVFNLAPNASPHATIIDIADTSSSQNFVLPKLITSGKTIPVSVNGEYADEWGNIIITNPAPTLQSVTDAGNTTSTSIISTGDIQLRGALLYFKKNPDGTGQSIDFSQGLIPVADYTIDLPDGTNGNQTLPLSVNGNFADDAGNITISTGGFDSTYIYDSVSTMSTNLRALISGWGIDDVLNVGQTLTVNREILLGGFSLGITGGFVGIGTASPVNALDVVGDISAGADGTYSVGLLKTDVANGLISLGDINGSVNLTTLLIDDVAAKIFYNATNGHIFSGNVGIGANPPTEPLHVEGNGKFAGTVETGGFTVSTLPAGIVGQLAYVTDADSPTYLGVAVGGGAITCPVFFDGTNWITH